MHQDGPLENKTRADPGQKGDTMDKQNKKAIDPELEGTTTDEAKEKLIAAATAAMIRNEEAQAAMIKAAQMLATNPANEQLFSSQKNLKELRAAYNKAVHASIASTVETFTTAMATLSEKLVAAMHDTAPALYFITDVYDLEPYLWPELQKLDPELEGISFNDYLDRYTVGEMLKMSLDPESDLAIALEAARKAKALAESFTAKRTENVEYPIDKPNSEIWKLFSEDPSGQLSYMIDMFPDKPQTAGMLYAIDFDALSNDVQISRRLEPYDKRVYIAASALFNSNKDTQDKAVITLSQIYSAMGNTGNCGKRDREKINNSLTKMTGARIYIDNAQEAKLLKGYPHFRYDASLLPMERITATVNGQTTEAAIKLLREPPMITFAKERRQITTIPVKLLQSPNSQTNGNLLIEDYLLERISKAKRAAKRADAKNKEKGPAEHKEKILLQTLYASAEITAKKQIQRAPETIKKYLNYYQEQGYITRYKMEPNGQRPSSITVYFTIEN